MLISAIDEMPTHMSNSKKMSNKHKDKLRLPFNLYREKYLLTTSQFQKVFSKSN